MEFRVYTPVWNLVSGTSSSQPSYLCSTCPDIAFPCLWHLDEISLLVLHCNRLNFQENNQDGRAKSNLLRSYYSRCFEKKVEEYSQGLHSCYLFYFLTSFHRYSWMLSRLVSRCYSWFQQISDFSSASVSGGAEYSCSNFLPDRLGKFSLMYLKQALLFSTALINCFIGPSLMCSYNCS